MKRIEKEKYLSHILNTTKRHVSYSNGRISIEQYGGENRGRNEGEGGFESNTRESERKGQIRYKILH